MKKRSWVIVGVVVLGLGIIISWIIGNYTSNSVNKITKSTARMISGKDGFSYDENTPGYETYIDLIQGCPGGKDCIPSIDNPKFESIAEANTWLEDSDVVFVLNYEGITRAYPQKILNRHEIVNDIVGDTPIAVTFCPLCGSSLAFERLVDGQVLEFGVSGKLHNNDLVMYDRQTENLWQQITGEAIVGDKIGTRLKQISLNGMRWSQYVKEFPGGEVLSGELSASSYDIYPYGDYEQSEDPLFPIAEGVDTTIHPKNVVYGVEHNNTYKAYPEEKIKIEGKIRDNIGNISIEIEYNDGNVKVIDVETKKEMVSTRLFWFAWKAFRPETTIY